MLMRVTGKITVGLLCFVIVSCSNQQETITATPINTPLPLATFTLPPSATFTAQPKPTLTLAEIGYFPTYIARFRFYEWRLSFTLPQLWVTPDYFNIVRVKHFADLDGNGDNYTFFSESVENDKKEKSAAEIRFRFQTIPKDLEPGNFSETDWEMCSDKGFQIEETTTPEKIGNDLYKPTMYKCSFDLEGVAKKQLYVIHAIHQTRRDIGIEIIMTAESNTFQKVKKEFLEFMDSLSFET